MGSGLAQKSEKNIMNMVMMEDGMEEGKKEKHKSQSGKT